MQWPLGVKHRFPGGHLFRAARTGHGMSGTGRYPQGAVPLPGEAWTNPTPTFKSCLRLRIDLLGPWHELTESTIISQSRTHTSSYFWLLKSLLSCCQTFQPGLISAGLRRCSMVQIRCHHFALKASLSRLSQQLTHVSQVTVT